MLWAILAAWHIPAFPVPFFVSVALSFALWFAGVLGRTWISLWYYEDIVLLVLSGQWCSLFFFLSWRLLASTPLECVRRLNCTLDLQWMVSEWWNTLISDLTYNLKCGFHQGRECKLVYKPLCTLRIFSRTSV